MTTTTLYKSKHGKLFRLNDKGKEFIDENWEILTLSEMAKIIGISRTSIKNYMRKKGYSKRLVGDSYNDFKERILEILKPYSGYLQYEEMRILLKDKHNISITKDQLLLIVKNSDIETSYSKGYIRVFIDGNKNNFNPNNIIMLTKKEHKYLRRIANVSTLRGEELLATIELVKLNIAINGIDDIYIAKNKKTGEVIKSEYHTEISKKITNRFGQYKDCKSIGENGERYIRDWVITREIRN